MSRVDRSPTAVTARLTEALRLGRAASPDALVKGIRTDGDSVSARLRQVDQLRQLALQLSIEHAVRWPTASS